LRLLANVLRNNQRELIPRMSFNASHLQGTSDYDV